jgi:hypothetical protein
LAITSGPQIWSLNDREEILKGNVISVSINQNGRMTAAPEVKALYSGQQPFAWCSVIDKSGAVYVGTGPEGKLLRISADGQSEVRTDFNEINVSALATDKSGNLFAATSPDGKVYRILADGKPEVYFDPKEKYIWALAFTTDGSLLVATGEKGRIYRVNQAGADPEKSVFYDTKSTHVISLAVDAAGNIYAGTDPDATVLVFRNGNKPFALLDSPLSEIHEIAIADDGSIYALAIADTVSDKQPQTGSNQQKNEKIVSQPKPNPGQPEPPKRSLYDLSNVKSVVYRIASDGDYDIIWSSANITAFSILPTKNNESSGVLIGTSESGRIYFADKNGNDTLLAETGAGQISQLLRTATDYLAVASNQVSLFLVGSKPAAEGLYESPVFDAKYPTRWGNIWWTATGKVILETRSGNSDSPDESWSQWQPVTETNGRGEVKSQIARFFQWRARISSGAELMDVRLVYFTKNIAPEITSLQMLDPNVGLAPNPPAQIDPNIELSGLDPASFGMVVAQPAPRRLFIKGARSFQWTAEDRNGDKLVYDVLIKNAAAKDWITLSRGQSENFYSLDTQSFSDGRYIIKVIARDSPSNTRQDERFSETESEAFFIDNTQPALKIVGDPAKDKNSYLVRFSAQDGGSFIARGEYSIDGGAWQKINPVDGIADSPDEVFAVPVPVDAKTVTLRVFDANSNVSTVSWTVPR